MGKMLKKEIVEIISNLAEEGGDIKEWIQKIMKGGLDSMEEPRESVNTPYTVKGRRMGTNLPIISYNCPICGGRWETDWLFPDVTMSFFTNCCHALVEFEPREE